MPAAQAAVRAAPNAVAASPVEIVPSACIVKVNVSPGVVPLATSLNSAMGQLRYVEHAQLPYIIAPMFATRLIEGESDAVRAVSSGTRPAHLRFVDAHCASWWWPALGEVPATGQGVLM
jgi:hypothetical protein